MWNGSRSGEQFIWRRGWNDRRTAFDEDGIGGKARARDGDFSDFADFCGIVFILRYARDLRSFGLDSDGVGRNGWGSVWREVIGQITRKNGEFGLCRITSGSRRVFVLVRLGNAKLRFAY